MLKRVAPLFCAALIVSACATTQPAESPETETEANDSSATDRAINNAQSGFGEAAMSPLEDINLVRDKIPDEFKAIKNPYRIDQDISCEQIVSELEPLDALLGRDWDIPPPDEEGLKERAADGASTAFLDAVASEASGLIPYRGIVRTLSGANSHSRKVRKAYERASHRRTFLKGVGLVKGCTYPAAPLPLPEEEEMIVFR